MTTAKQKKQIKTAQQVAASWGRAALSAAIAYYLATGDVTIKGLTSAAAAAVLPPLLRYVNPKDELGRG
jgi:hypothetical protein